MDPRAVEMWRSLRDRWAASPVRGQRQGHPVDSPGAAHRLPPPLPTDCPTFPTFPPLAACGRDRRRNFDFFPTPLRGVPPLRASLANPFHCRTGAGGGAGEAGGTPQGCPRGVEGEPEGLTGGRHAPAPWGVDSPPSGGLLEGEGEPPGGRGNPAGVPRERSENSPKTDQKCCIEES